jgi:CoA:oxalate CoA-transferase
LGSRHPSIAPFEALATRDGHIVVAAGNDELFAALCDVLGLGGLVRDDRFRSNDLRRANADALSEILESTLVAEPNAHWLAVLERAGVPCGPLNDIAAVVDDPQVIARNMIVHTRSGDAPAVAVAGNPIKLSGYSDPTERDEAPELDADRERILAELGEV